MINKILARAKLIKYKLYKGSILLEFEEKDGFPILQLEYWVGRRE